MNPTRDMIRCAPCPTCGAKPGAQCSYPPGRKGSAKAMRTGRNHHARMEAVQRLVQEHGYLAATELLGYTSHRVLDEEAALAMSLAP